MKTRQIVLSRAWGLSVKDAERVAAVSGVVGVTFAPAIVRSGGQRVAAARAADQRGAWYCFNERRGG